jgi:hypothetical protein
LQSIIFSNISIAMANSVAIQSPRGSLIQLAGNAGTDPPLFYGFCL